MSLSPDQVVELLKGLGANPRHERAVASEIRKKKVTGEVLAHLIETDALAEIGFKTKLRQGKVKIRAREKGLIGFGGKRTTGGTGGGGGNVTFSGDNAELFQALVDRVNGLEEESRRHAGLLKYWTTRAKVLESSVRGLKMMILKQNENAAGKGGGGGKGSSNNNNKNNNRDMKRKLAAEKKALQNDVKDAMAELDDLVAEGLLKSKTSDTSASSKEPKEPVSPPPPPPYPGNPADQAETPKKEEKKEKRFPTIAKDLPEVLSKLKVRKMLLAKEMAFTDDTSENVKSRTVKARRNVENVLYELGWYEGWQLGDELGGKKSVEMASKRAKNEMENVEKENPSSNQVEEEKERGKSARKIIDKSVADAEARLQALKASTQNITNPNSVFEMEPPTEFDDENAIDNEKDKDTEKTVSTLSYSLAGRTFGSISQIKLKEEDLDLEDEFE
eukprot:g713.t1